jgi:hypothetical protein
MKSKFVAAIKDKNYRYIGELHTMFCILDDKRKEEALDPNSQTDGG